MPGGRPPKPSATRELEGNPGKRKRKTKEPKPAAERVPSAPAHLDSEAKREFRRVSKHLHDAGLLTQIDRSALAAYCQTYSRWAHAEKCLRDKGPIVKSPSGYPIRNPYLDVANAAIRDLHRYLVEFGMTPSSRTKLATDEPNEDAEEDFLSL